MQNNDMPKIWNGNDFFAPEEEIIPENTNLVKAEKEEAPLPSIKEQNDIIDNSDLNDINKSILGSLIEINNTAKYLAKIQNEESKEQRNAVIDAICSSFIHARMTNNAQAERLKFSLLNRLMDNIENLDLETVAKIYNDLTEVTAIDAQQALSKISGNNLPSAGGPGGINLTLNNITGDGAGVTQNTLSVGNNAPIANLSTISNLNRTVNDWGKVPTKADIINTTSTEK